MRFWYIVKKRVTFMKDSRTTTAHFQIFKKEVRLWANRFGLKHWRIVFYHEDADDNDPCMAWMNTAFNDKIANIGLARSWPGEEVTVHKIKRSAFHEAVHLLLSDLVILGQERWSVQGAYQAEEHAVIRRLEALFYGDGEN